MTQMKMNKILLKEHFHHRKAICRLQWFMVLISPCLRPDKNGLSGSYYWCSVIFTRLSDLIHRGHRSWGYASGMKMRLEDVSVQGHTARCPLVSHPEALALLTSPSPKASPSAAITGLSHLTHSARDPHRSLNMFHQPGHWTRLPDAKRLVIQIQDQEKICYQ